jgi:hypothetical protein
MSLNSADQAWFASYKALPPALKDAVDSAVRLAQSGVEAHGMRAAVDVRAEAFIASVTRYVVESAAAV